MKFSRRGGRPEVNISEEEKPKAGRWKVTRSWENMDELERGRAIRISHRTMKRETDFYWRFHGLSVAAIRGSKRCSSACCAFDRYRLDRLNVVNWLKTVPAMWNLAKFFKKFFQPLLVSIRRDRWTTKKKEGESSITRGGRFFLGRVIDQWPPPVTFRESYHPLLGTIPCLVRYKITRSIRYCFLVKSLPRFM